MLSVEILANTVNDSWDDFYKYYHYRGGKLKFERESKKELNELKNLVETKTVAEIWKHSIGNLKPTDSVLMEQAVWLTLCLDWGFDSQIFFDYENKKVRCINNKSETIEI